MTSNKQHLKESMLHPNALYDTPDEVINDKNLSDHDKIDVLKNWADGISQRLEAAAENMTPDKNNLHEEELLRKITSCLEDFKKSRKQRVYY